MITLSNLDSLIAYINKDKESTRWSDRRYPIRFILLPDLWLIKDLLKVFNWAERVEISKFLTYEDGWLTPDGISNIIFNLNSQKDHLILSISELLRSYSDTEFRSLIITLLNIENTDKGNRRIYIPVFGLYERFQNFLDLYLRKKEWNPVWKLEGDISKIKLYTTRVSYNYKASINTTKDLLELWKQEKIEEIFCRSNTFYLISQNIISDQTLEIKRIDNEKELLSIYGIDVPIPYKKEDAIFWNKTLELLQRSEDPNFESLVKTSLNVLEIKKDDLINLWIGKDKFTRWLLKWYVSTLDEWKNDYITHIMENLKTLDEEELIEALWFKIFELNSNIKEIWLVERRNYLRSLYNRAKVPPKIEKEIAERLEQIGDVSRTLKLITGVSSTERSLIIELIGRAIKEGNTYLDHLKDIYPELYYYLDDTVEPNNVTEENRWIIEYFKEYRHSRITNEVSERLNRILNEKNKDESSFYKWYYYIEDFRDYLQNKEVDQIILIDALGAEWFSLIIKMLEEKGFYIEGKYIARVNLPSTTEVNKIEGSEYIYSLDKFIHSRISYNYPEDLKEEIEIIKEIISEQVVGNKTILITSDHGFTAFASSKFNNIKKYNFPQAKHEGRYMWIDKEMIRDSDFVIHESVINSQSIKAIVSLRYTSLSDVPRREVHGGATPEEVLVPVIYAVRKEISYQVEILNEDILARNPVLEFKIKPKVADKPSVWYKNKSLEISYDKDKDTYSAKLSGYKPGEYTLTVKIGGWEKEIYIKIKGGLKEQDII